jgi:hypothetical protein
MRAGRSAPGDYDSPLNHTRECDFAGYAALGDAFRLAIIEWWNPKK